ncbi:PspA/IM30 family protein [Fictibacillus sp. KIGAM418]|uniref:PspA/IM30 family protein n=1 Tax=Fictibacillus marinisediminis TaxID=2878389 RepID=A0A9X2BJ58_9BACL|nr:PspA/IM30 family protein [Fictibacillus marinisediminis]MCK6259333.1 PspA/IM30 family protein [Fictibacillus marinisediminis]
MSTLFTRIKNSIAADFHEMLDQKEQKNPISLLNQYLRQCEQETDRVRKLVERQFILTEEFTKEYREAKAHAEKRKRQADLALQAGESDLHEFAVNEQQRYDERAARMHEAKLEAKRELEALEQKFEQMKHKLKDMYVKRMELMGRENVARAHRGMNKVLDSGMGTKPGLRFDEMERYLERLEHQVNTDYHLNTIDERFAQLEKKWKKEEKPAIS